MEDRMDHLSVEAARLAEEWRDDPRWRGVMRDYTAEAVVRLRGSIREQHTIAYRMAAKLWDLLVTEDYVNALGALSGGQAVQMVKAGLRSIYLSGWQVAGDGNLAGEVYPDQSLYPANSAPAMVKRINNALRRADQIHWAEGDIETDWFVPIVADAEAGFGGALNVFEITKAFIEAGAAGVHLEDQLAAEKKCGHMGGKVLVPTGQHIRALQAARLASDVMGVPTIIVARTDANSATLLTSDIDERDRRFVVGERTPEGFHRVTGGLEAAIARGLAYAPYSDLIWCETAKPDLEEAKRFAEAINAEFPGKMLAYNCSPSFNWSAHLDESAIARFQKELGAMGYRYQFITLAGFHALNASMFRLARGYAEDGMTAYVELQDLELAMEDDGYTATRHQREVGAGYFDLVTQTVSAGSTTLAMTGSTEEEQF
ncbi:MAG: isocitrate lyase [Actinobacteria bacterium]|nr:isocitrate lyase [Actinomycetota bacterium]MCI0542873.1 isocitrate lyase [Actinomycetota bacterium]MCI0679507.1 isocitrate lyase [Actinomycetota bacterium]